MLGRVLLAIVFVLAVVPAVRFTFELSRPPNFHNYGVVQTRFGEAVVACGGEVSSGCGKTTASAFVTCSDPLLAYFNGVYEPAGIDAPVHELIAKRPPSGPTWSWTCGFHGLPNSDVAKLDAA